MPDVKISAGADPVTLVATDKLPIARSASTTAYAATMTELAAFANTTYVPNYYAGSPAMDGAASAGTAAFVARGDHVHPSDTTRVAKAGDTMAGFLTLNANPTANLHAATKQYVDGSAPVGGPYLSVAAMHDVGRNLIHNPLFNVAQRGVGPWNTSNTYMLDRWRLDFVLDATAANPVDISSVVAFGDEAAQQGLQMNVTGNAGAGAFTVVSQYIENVRRLSGKTVTVSFWAYATTGAPKIGVAGQQSFGTGGSPSASVPINGTPVTLSNTAARYSVTFAYPSVAGKTLGTNNDHSSRLALFFSSGATNNAFAGSIGVQSAVFILWGVQLEVGSVATPLEKPDPRYDLANCQRFYQTGSFSIYGYNTAGSYLAYVFALPVPMRGTPTVTPTTGGSANASTTGVIVSAGSFGYLQAQCTATATGAVNYFGSFTASADL